ncbi:hypothetical protein DP117_27180 [Brasilonema sp. UFV-L1]|nr:hypothetical protein [Brasilonema sp. UFV-L1]
MNVNAERERLEKLYQKRLGAAIIANIFISALISSFLTVIAIRAIHERGISSHRIHPLQESKHE